jgi:hypothetical protein
MKYSEIYQPPAPVAKVTLRNRDTLESIDNVPMLLDTGSDITILSRRYCNEIGVSVSETESLELVGFNQTKSVAYYVRLDFIFLNKIFRGTFLVYDYPEGIIGRDILNEFSILFNGKNLEWSLQR